MDSRNALEKLTELFSLGFIGEDEYIRRKAEIGGTESSGVTAPKPFPGDVRAPSEDLPTRQNVSHSAEPFKLPDLPRSKFNVWSWDQGTADTGLRVLPNFGEDHISPGFVASFFAFAHYTDHVTESPLPLESRTEQEALPAAFATLVKVPQGPELLAQTTADKVRSARLQASLFQSLALAGASHGQNAYRTDIPRDKIVVYFRFATDGPVQFEIAGPIPLAAVVSRFIGWGVSHAALCAVGSWREREAIWISDPNALVTSGHYTLHPAQATRFRSGWRLQVHCLNLGHQYQPSQVRAPSGVGSWSSREADSKQPIVVGKRQDPFLHLKLIVAARNLEVKFFFSDSVAPQQWKSQARLRSQAKGLPSMRLSLRKSTDAAKAKSACFLCGARAQMGTILCESHQDKTFTDLFLLAQNADWESNSKNAAVAGPASDEFPPMPYGAHETERPLDPSLPAPWRAPRFAYVDPKKGYKPQDANKLRSMGFQL